MSKPPVDILVYPVNIYLCLNLLKQCFMIIVKQFCTPHNNILCFMGIDISIFASFAHKWCKMLFAIYLSFENTPHILNIQLPKSLHNSAKWHQAL